MIDSDQEAKRLEGLIVLMRLASYAKQNEHVRESLEIGARKLEAMLEKWDAPTEGEGDDA